MIPPEATATRPLPGPGMRLLVPRFTRAHVESLASALGVSSLGVIGRARPEGEVGVMGWGLKPSALRARDFAQRHKLAYWSVEDAFLRSVGLGKDGAACLSFAFDDLGIYYDASRPSRLEAMLAGNTIDGTARARAAALRAFIVKNRLSKYNLPNETPADLPAQVRRRVLLVDQTAGDLSITGALANREAFVTMLSTALLEAPDAEILLKLHPDAIAGFTAGALGNHEALKRITLVSGFIEPDSLFEAVDEVWTVSSLLGFEALLRGKTVRTFGVPFYAGWGLTDDRASGEAARNALARRNKTPRDLDTLVHGALIEYPVYADPATGERMTPEAAADRLVQWRREAKLLGQNQLCVGISAWKRPHVRSYLALSGGRIRFVSGRRAERESSPETTVATWGMKINPAAATHIRAAGSTLIRIEDGFIRSVGLGSDFLFPLSLCADRTGIYYDATQPSDLETALNRGAVSPEQTTRARILRERLVALGITKYNLSGALPADLRERAAGRTTVLVLGQVPDDFSIKLGLGLPRGNLDLLARVRAEHCDDFILYKEHPDVVSGNRPGLTPVNELARYADLVLTEGDTAQLIGLADHVHITTSLAGFEALMRGKRVTCWGAPFYSGWGLTEDRVKIERRKARHTIDSLIWRTLYEYAIYRLPGSAVPVSPETVLDYIEHQRNTAPPFRPQAGFYRWLLRSRSYLDLQLKGWLNQRF